MIETDLLTRVARTLRDEGYDSDGPVEAVVEELPPFLGTYSDKGPKVEWMPVVGDSDANR